MPASDSSAPSACLLLIGNELLSGRTQDRNLAYIGRRLSELGIQLLETRVIADDTAVIVANVNDCRQRYDYVFTTGGIGPTHDDITTDAIAKAFDRPLQRNADAEQTLRNFYGEALNAARLKMATLPDGALPITNKLSGAPGFQVDNVFVLAGIPSVMQAMFEALVERLEAGAPILSLTLKTNCREGELAAGLSAVQDKYATVSIGSYPFFDAGQYGVNLVLRGTDQALLEQAAVRVEELIASLSGNFERLSG